VVHLRFGSISQRLSIGQIAFGAYKLDDSTGTYRPYTLQVLFLRGDRIREIAGFVEPELFRHFDLPAEIAA